jgi:hypothetical protein
VQRILDQISAPATVRNARLDYVGANPLGRALYAPLFDSREQPTNSARFTFLDPGATDFYPDWDRVASELVAHSSPAGRRRRKPPTSAANAVPNPYRPAPALAGAAKNRSSSWTFGPLDAPASRSQSSASAR